MKGAAVALALGFWAIGCMPHELVLRRANVDWDGLGIRSLGVRAVIPDARDIPDVPDVSPADEASASAASRAELASATRDAAELLAFALARSAVDVLPASDFSPYLEVTVKEVLVTDEAAEAAREEALQSEEATGTPGKTGKAKARTVFSDRDALGYLRLPERYVRATVLVRLISDAAGRPLWFKEAVGRVDLGQVRAGPLAGSDPFPPPRLLDGSDDGEALRYFRELAVRRALKQIADDLLPRYEYREVS